MATRQLPNCFQFASAHPTATQLRCRRFRQKSPLRRRPPAHLRSRHDSSRLTIASCLAGVAMVVPRSRRFNFGRWIRRRSGCRNGIDGAAVEGLGFLLASTHHRSQGRCATPSASLDPVIFVEHNGRYHNSHLQKRKEKDIVITQTQTP